jgi:hypothetical protein
LSYILVHHDCFGIWNILSTATSQVTVLLTGGGCIRDIFDISCNCILNRLAFVTLWQRFAGCLCLAYFVDDVIRGVTDMRLGYFMH